MRVRNALVVLSCLGLVALALACTPKKPEQGGGATNQAPATTGGDGAGSAASSTPASAPMSAPASVVSSTPASAPMSAPSSAGGEAPAAGGTYANPAMLDPSKATEKAPEKFRVKFSTSEGDFTIEATREWSPNGVDRLYNLVKIGYYDNVAFFRVIGGFMAQFGIHGDPAVNAKWREAKIQDDQAKPGVSNKPGYISFAMAGPGTRTTQMFINFVDNGRLDSMGFTPIAQVVEGMDVVNKIYSGYGEGAPMGRGPSQGNLQFQGNAYLQSQFPELDYIRSAQIVQ